MAPTSCRPVPRSATSIRPALQDVKAERFGRNLARARRHIGVSQEELAVHATLHRTEVGLLERGERLARIDTALKLAGALGVPFDHLIAGIEWQPGSVRRGGSTSPAAPRRVVAEGRGGGSGIRRRGSDDR